MNFTKKIFLGITIGATCLSKPVQKDLLNQAPQMAVKP